jgi:hypothetical protein
LIVHRAAELRMWVQNNGYGREICRFVVVAGFDAAYRAVYDDFRHDLNFDLKRGKKET